MGIKLQYTTVVVMTETDSQEWMTEILSALPDTCHIYSTM